MAEPTRTLRTRKNRVVMYEDRVEKTFDPAYGGSRRARRERACLERLADLDGIPRLVDIADGGLRLTVSRVDGTPLPDLDDAPAELFADLARLIESMLARGVARHSLPPRDVLVQSGGRAGLVDFERTTLRGPVWGPSWGLACAITRFHVLRLVRDHAPETITPRQARLLRFQEGVQAAFRSVVRVRSAFRLWRRPPGAPGGPPAGS